MTPSDFSTRAATAAAAGDDGAPVYIDVVTYSGGAFEAFGFDAHGGVQGKWLAVSLQGAVIPVGFQHLVNLHVEPPLTACTTKPLVFTNGVLSDIKVGNRGGGGGGVMLTGMLIIACVCVCL